MVTSLGVFYLDWHIAYVTSVVLFLGVPSLVLSFLNQSKVLSVAKFSILVGVPVAVIFELLAKGDASWYVPQSIVAYRLFGFMPLEDCLWMFFVTYLCIMFYEVVKRAPDSGRGNDLKMVAILYGAMTICLVLFATNPHALKVPYAFLWLGLVLILSPTVVGMIRMSGRIADFGKVQIFFMYTHGLFELVGVRLNHWVFQGEHYLGWIRNAGLGFPVEEFLFVIALGGMAACVYYEGIMAKNANARSILAKRSEIST